MSYNKKFAGTYPIYNDFDAKKGYVDEEYFNNYYEERIHYLGFEGVLRSLRDDIGASSEKISESSHISRTYLSQLENGHRLPSNKTIQKLSQGLSFTSVTIFRKSSGRGYVNVMQSEFLNDLRKHYEKLLVTAKRETENINSLSNINVDDYAGDMTLSNQDIQLLRVFHSMDTEARNLFMSMSRYLAKDETDEFNEETD